MNFLVDYLDSDGVERHTSFKADAERQHRRMATLQICRCLKAEGYTPQQITCIPGDYSFAELEQMCKNGLPQSIFPLDITCEVVNINQPYTR